MNRWINEELGQLKVWMLVLSTNIETEQMYKYFGLEKSHTQMIIPPGLLSTEHIYSDTHKYVKLVSSQR
jgi:hypothetical protein